MNDGAEWNIRAVDRCVSEYFANRNKCAYDPVSLAEAALYVEDLFNITLSDSEITESYLATSDSMIKLVIAKLFYGETTCAESAGL